MTGKERALTLSLLQLVMKCSVMDFWLSAESWGQTPGVVLCEIAADAWKVDGIFSFAWLGKPRR